MLCLVTPFAFLFQQEARARRWRFRLADDCCQLFKGQRGSNHALDVASIRAQRLGIGEDGVALGSDADDGTFFSFAYFKGVCRDAATADGAVE